jgi:cytoskeletal protein CcmA (bactofilin family)
MFRRKEESAADTTSTTAANPAQHPAAAHQDTAYSTPASAAPTQDSASHSSAQPAQASTAATVTQPAAQHSSYAPITAAARTASEPARPAAAAPASNYRPAAAAEFNRSPARPASEPMRPSTQSGSSFASSPEKAPGTKSNRRVLTVGNDILLKGEIATCDRLVIEGRVEAKLSDVHTVEIAESGSFKGTAEVEDAEISGVFEGDLVVRNRLVIYASGEVRGNITYGEIEIERGGRLTGQIKTVAQGGAKAKPFDATESKSRAKEATFAA